MLENKRGQVATTLTWVVATITILIVMLLFMFASGALGGISDIKGFIGGGEIVALRFPEQQQTLFAIASEGKLTEAEVKPILEKIGPEWLRKASDGWGLEIFENDKSVNIVRAYSRAQLFSAQNFYTVLKDKPETKLLLYLWCDGDICRDNLK